MVSEVMASVKAIRVRGRLFFQGVEIALDLIMITCGHILLTNGLAQTFRRAADRQTIKPDMVSLKLFRRAADNP